MHMRYIKPTLFIVTVFLFSIVSGQQNKPGSIGGVIKDARTKSPLREAVITLISAAFRGQKFALTDSAGFYKVTNLPAGKYEVIFEMEGYNKVVQDSLTLEDGMTVDLNYEMIKGRKKSGKSEAQVTSYK